MEWAEETIVRLRALWDEGLSTAEIGRRLGVSKNAVVGKAHRLDLPARPSPIRRDGSGGAPRRKAPRRLSGPTLPPLSSTTPLVSAPSGPTMPAQIAALAVKPAMPPPARVASPPPRPYGRVVTCCWPLGEPGTPSFRFCDEASEPGKPYCADHVRLAYVKLRDRREDAA
jgi:GcrA cell cycle regulator